MESYYFQVDHIYDNLHEDNFSEVKYEIFRIKYASVSPKTFEVKIVCRIKTRITFFKEYLKKSGTLGGKQIVNNQPIQGNQILSLLLFMEINMIIYFLGY